MITSAKRLSFIDDMITTCAKGLYFSEPRGVFFADRGRVSCFKARVRMINGELPNSPLVGSYSWFGSITRSSNLNGFVPGASLKKFHNLSSVKFSAGAAHNVSFDGNSREEQLANSTVESGQTLKLLCTDEEKTGGEDAHSVQSSAGAARDVLFDGNSREEQLANSTLVSGQTLKLLSGSCYLPHPDKEETGGEDAHFICANEQVIGVADGVGGWADVGINAGLYARELMLNSVSAIQEEPVGSIDPARVLEKAHSNTKAKGSSTACIVALINEEIRAINLGDSGFMVVRDGCTVFQSPAQQHCFNFPYQLESGNEGDLPSSGQIVMASFRPQEAMDISYLDVHRIMSYGVEMSWFWACCDNYQENRCNIANITKYCYTLLHSVRHLGRKDTYGFLGLGEIFNDAHCKFHF
ncbi:hypothetical protein JCGZ_23784 [Jatropha curcas]|uniref:Protein phosphatase n=1 Tax=Jatropha curcas TaxID=180498 RepID=A0A067L357_JATCU|nr:hypothetical protein JCGZ_23784 [Jatropha curcas]